MADKTIAEKVAEALGLNHLLPGRCYLGYEYENEKAIEILLKQVCDNAMEIKELKKQVEGLKLGRM
jgi:hypothetical protein